MTSVEAALPRLREGVEARRETLVRFLREICAIPSIMGQIGDVGRRIAREMESLDFDEVRFDRMGNVLGRVGSGPIRILYDSHIDTVGVGDRSAWGWDPFQGKIENGVLFARGACDEKGSTPGMIHGMALARDIGLLSGFTLYYFGNMEEDCDGQAPNVLAEVEGIRPDFVIVGEPTRMQIYRGHKGRVELKVVAKGRSSHAASNWLGDNALYKMIPILEGIRALDARLPSDAFLGKATVTPTLLECSTASINAVPDECTLTLDRRLTFGETREEAISQVEALVPRDSGIRVEMLHYDTPSYTGYSYPVEKYFPAWALAENHRLVRAGARATELLWGRPAGIGKWNFSTNATYWMGKAGIPSIGFAPGDEDTAHTTIDQVPLEDVVQATAFYAILPAVLASTPA
jgi:putative selenium metabolism hydrolase